MDVAAVEKAVLEAMIHAMIMVDNQGRVMMWNQAAEKVFGYRVQDVMGRPLHAFIVPSHLLDHYKKNLAYFSRAGKGALIGKPVETVARRSDGTEIPVELSISSIKIRNAWFAAGVVRDISDHKRMEQEVVRLDRLRVIGEMAAGIAHEIRNPMTAVRGFLQIMMDEPDLASYHNYFDFMIEELDSANSIIDEFLSLAENKAVDLQTQDLNSIIEGLAPLLQTEALQCDKSIIIMPGDIPELLLDSKQIRQLIRNLVRNGLEAMEAGGILTLRTWVEEEDVVLVIRDQGHGIDPQILPKLGTPFFSTKDQGTGLGLAACYSIATRHNATIQVESSSRGTAFYVRFRNAGHLSSAAV